ncbi:hypothetical protein J3F83DRAFT_148592 [Trichoderma novae-zelandiae]
MIGSPAHSSSVTSCSKAPVDPRPRFRKPRPAPFPAPHIPVIKSHLQQECSLELSLQPHPKFLTPAAAAAEQTTDSRPTQLVSSEIERRLFLSYFFVPRPISPAPRNWIAGFHPRQRPAPCRTRNDGKFASWCKKGGSLLSLSRINGKAACFAFCFLFSFFSSSFFFLFLSVLESVLLRVAFLDMSNNYTPTNGLQLQISCILPH